MNVLNYAMRVSAMVAVAERAWHDAQVEWLEQAPTGTRVRVTDAPTIGPDDDAILVQVGPGRVAVSFQGTRRAPVVMALGDAARSLRRRVDVPK